MKNDTSNNSPEPQAPREVQGEGDYEAARRYRDEVKDFLANSDIEQLAHKAAPESARQAQELAQAEEDGKARSKGDDQADAGLMYSRPARTGSV